MHFRYLPLLRTGAGLILLACSLGAEAQCLDSITWGSPNIGMISGNPFSAERTFELVGKANIPIQRSPELLARDSAGRFRTERVVGKYKILNGTEAGRETEQRIISICDPVSHQLITLDTLNKTAKITAQVMVKPQYVEDSPKVFCKLPESLSKSPNIPIEDLGHKIVEGLDTEGVRITMQLPSGQMGTGIFQPGNFGAPKKWARCFWRFHRLHKLERNTKAG